MPKDHIAMGDGKDICAAFFGFKDHRIITEKHLTDSEGPLGGHGSAKICGFVTKPVDTLNNLNN